jgi:oxygen-independent coproporphyrinogen-3 oxidase
MSKLVSNMTVSQQFQFPNATAFSSLYVHFPFCESKCHYCDFYSIGRERTRESDPELFAQAIEIESTLLAKQLSENSRFDTIFFGGGTPTMTDPGTIEQALKPLRALDRITPQTEWTTEANPSSVTAPNMKRLRALGLNRVSLGVQSTQNEFLKSMGRAHLDHDVDTALDAIFSSGFTNVSVDLLCGIPGQTTDHLGESLSRLTSSGITHLSCYLLTLNPQHRLYKDLPDENEQIKHLLFIDQWLKDAGFEHYEISNFAKPGFQARHNLHYWNGGSYLSLGPSAHSYSSEAKLRWKNISSLHKYCRELIESRTLPIDSLEQLTPKETELERWMLTLRLSTGFPKSWLDTEARQAHANRLQIEGLLESHPTNSKNLRLTAKGFALSDGIIRSLV